LDNRDALVLINEIARFDLVFKLHA
jgi:hypothetical protein